MRDRVREATMAVLLEYAKRKPSVAEQDKFYELVEELVGAATTLGALENEDEQERALLRASGRAW